MNRKIIFLDVDGTLYSPVIGGTPKSALEAIELAKKAGHKVLLCTGRSLAGATKYLHFPVDGFIFGTGASVYVDGKHIYDNPLSKTQLKTLMKQVEDLDIPYILEAAAGIYGDKVGYDYIVNYYGGNTADEEKRLKVIRDNNIYHFDYLDENESIYKLCIFLRNLDQMKDLEEKIEEPFVLTLSAFEPNHQLYIVEITNGLETKATGIQKVMDYFGLGKEDAIGIGDSANDIPMLDYCGLAIAMGNGAEEAKEHADFITRDILDDGIYYAFQHFHLMEEMK
ncbi:HAD family hydrolase [Bulleidia sp. zg-1006]|uniref:HAD family hydrolase n=1 Tax=Bulleidia sp. zg-1006 TaxID=2806552 RepID=UPI001939F541|nr:HAD family hydrolase [Bulleidia sp. zg-1006]QRG86676.1 Cof-type HAD-IIB family hydrolase [Bulleidia sp. zg-1006]